MRHLKLLFAITIFIGVFGCKSKINQIVMHKREGKWVIQDTLDFIYTVKGKYRKGEEIGTWKYFDNGKLIRREKYQKQEGICKNVFYHPNGKIMKKGTTKLENNTNEDHWYYYGEWQFFNPNGKLDSIKIYEKETF